MATSPRLTFKTLPSWNDLEAGATHLCLYFFDLTQREILAPTVEAVAKTVGR